jgi:hypothetical protein
MYGGTRLPRGDKGEGKVMCGSALVTFRGACIYAFEGAVR